MSNRQTVKDITPQGEVKSIFLVGASALLQARNGPYWKLELRDATGSVEAKIWSPQSQEYTEIAPGSMIAVEGRSGAYRDQVQVTIENLRVLGEEEGSALDLREFLPASERPAEEMLEELIELAEEEFSYKPWFSFVLAVLRDKGGKARLLAAPAAKSVHHAYAGGLLEHILSVSRLCMRLADHYEELDRQVLLAGAIFHDYGKIWEFSGGLVNDYSDEGRLIGHVNLALEHLAPFMEKAVKSGLEPELLRHFKHLILSHHGEHAFGAVCLPQTAEALILHYADNIDAKMAQCRGLFRDWEGREGWSPYQQTLGRFMHQPKRTPADESLDRKKAPAKQNKEVNRQCSLLSKA